MSQAINVAKATVAAPLGGDAGELNVSWERRTEKTQRIIERALERSKPQLGLLKVAHEAVRKTKKLVADQVEIGQVPDGGTVAQYEAAQAELQNIQNKVDETEDKLDEARKATEKVKVAREATEKAKVALEDLVSLCPLHCAPFDFVLHAASVASSLICVCGCSRLCEVKPFTTELCADPLSHRLKSEKRRRTGKTQRQCFTASRSHVSRKELP